MSKFYITMGQTHVHIINGKTIDKNCIAEIEADSHEAARDIAVGLFDIKFCASYNEEDMTDNMRSYFPRGIIKVN